MPAPKPLTACPAPDLDWSRPKTPVARDFDDVYFSVDGGLAESRSVFINGCDLETRWAQHPERTHVIGELGFGTGLNLMAVWDLWEQQDRTGRLHFISIEKFPFPKAELKRVSETWPDLASRYDRLLQLWPGRVKGFHHLELTANLSLTLIHDDVEPALDGLEARVDSWFLDGFSPAKNPDMWSEKIMYQIARLSATNARLATFTVAGSVRNALIDAGFTVFKKEGFGRKRHRLEAVHTPSPDSHNSTRQITSSRLRPVIIGGGIAGASVARAFARAGIKAILIEKDTDLKSAASGNPAAIVRPRLDLQDQPQNRFFLSSYLYALRAYSQTPAAIITRGVKHLAKTPEEKIRFETLAQQAALPAEHLDLHENGLDMKQALVIDPKAVIADWTTKAEKITAKVVTLERTHIGWNCLDYRGEPIASGTHIILCSGAEFKIIPYPTGKNNWPALRLSKGQLSWAESSAEIDAPLTYGGYVVPMDDGILVGATHTRLDDEPHSTVNTDADQANLAKLFEATGIALELSDKSSRASVRVTTPDTLPVLDNVEDTLWILSGLGSRGFVFAPLLGTALVSQITGEPVPIETSVIQRFQIRSRFSPRSRNQ